MHAYVIGTGMMARSHEQSPGTCAVTRLAHVYTFEIWRGEPCE